MSDEKTNHFNDLLNTSTPFAPRSEEEVRARVDAFVEAAPEAARTADHSQDHKESARVENTGEPAGVQAGSAADPSPGSIIDDEAEALLAKFMRPARSREEQPNEIDVLRARAETTTACCRVDGVEATVNGLGQVLSLEISEDLYRGPHLRMLGKSVLEAITKANVNAAEQMTEGEL